MLDVGGVGLITALFAGAVSFLSPCVLPLVPGYLSTVTGVAAGDLEQADWRKVLPPALLFVASFSVVFIIIGLSATGLSQTLRTNQTTLDKISGIVMMVMGLFFVATLFVTRLNFEFHFDRLMQRVGAGGPIVAGIAFSFAWSPCISPTLTAILGLAASDDSVWSGGILLAVYSLGLAIPFLLSALAFSRMTTAFDIVKRHYGVIMAFGGLVLIAMGYLVYTSELTRVNAELLDFLDGLGISFFSEA